MDGPERCVALSGVNLKGPVCTVFVKAPPTGRREERVDKPIEPEIIGMMT